MPLPDERPRQSVANLIGRFEKQKSSSGSAPPPVFPRTSSVASHRTGDSAQEEVREKREWPPKSVEKPATSVLPPIQALEQRSSSASLSPPISKEKYPSPETEVPITSTAPKSARTSPPVTASRQGPVPAAPAAPAIIKSPLTQTKPSTIRTPSTVKSPSPKRIVKTPTTAPLKPHTSGGSASASSTPLKPQHTGQSTTSIGTATRAAGKLRASAPPKTPAASTPVRAKTPLSNARPKTPSSTARPKTPSSGLYAPTAASLARSKAGAPAPPPAEKPKRKITTDLSKPTAASASRIRSTTSTLVTRGGKTPATSTATKTVAGSSTTKATTPAKQSSAVKPRVGKGVAGLNKDVAVKKTSPSLRPSDTTASTPAAIAVESAAKSHEVTPESVSEHFASDADDTMETEPEEIAHSVDEEHADLEDSGSHSEEIENYDEDFPEDRHDMVGEHENGYVELVDEAPSVEERNPDHIAEPEHIVHQHDEPFVAEDVDNAPVGTKSPQLPPESHDVSSELHHSEDIVEPEPLQDEGAEPKDVTTEQSTAGTELEDIVNLLESGPTILRLAEVSPSIGNVSEAGDIPDELND